MLLLLSSPSYAWDWNCHPECDYEDPVTEECDTTSTWEFPWCHDSVVDNDLVYPILSYVGVAPNQSTSLGTPALAYVGKPASSTLPYTFALRSIFGTDVETICTYTNTTTVTHTLLSEISLSALPSGEAYAAWVLRVTTSSSCKVRLMYAELDEYGDWETPVQLTEINVYAYQYYVGSFDIQMHDPDHYAWGGSYWTKPSSYGDYTCHYLLTMVEDGTPIALWNDHIGVEDDDDDPAVYGPVPFSYGVGTSSSSPSTVVVNKGTGYSYGSPVGLKLTAFNSDTAPTAEAVVANHLVSYFAMAITNAGNRYVVFHHQSGAHWLDCATSSTVGTWTQHEASGSGGPWYIEDDYGEPIAAVADPTEDSDAFDVVCWTPGSYDPNIQWVLRHSTGTNYTVDDVVYDTSSLLQRPHKKSIGSMGGGENLVHVYTSLHKSEMATNP